MDDRRVEMRKLADVAWEEYEFGEGVVVSDFSGWESDSGTMELSRRVYVEDEGDEQPSVSLTFTVRFRVGDGDSLVITDCYAIDSKGSIWGQPSVSHAGMVTISVSLQAKIMSNGEDEAYLENNLRLAIERAVGMGALTGDGPAEVDEWTITTTLARGPLADINEDAVAAWLEQCIRSGKPESDLARQMARYALADPLVARREIAGQLMG